MKIKRAIIIILDGFGCGEMPDAEKFDDTGANTLGNIAKAVGGMELPNLSKIGLCRIGPAGSTCKKEPLEITGAFGKMSEKSVMKDTNVGHWEIAGLITTKPFPTYPDGFPKEVIEKFESHTGKKTLGNYASSGTEIIKKLGEEHVNTGNPIVYTSADSVFQIASHEEVIPLEELYRLCKIAREQVMVGEHRVGRIIARPFTGKPGNFKRTSNRRDYGVPPHGETLLDKVKKAGGDVLAVGKIEDIFSGQGITRAVHTENNSDGIDKTLQYIGESASAKGPELIFTNLVDFDMLWGHRRDVKAFYRGLVEFDLRLNEILSAMRADDILFITADHGNDPTYVKHTDHTREYVPLLVYGKKIKSGVDLGTRESFADLGQTIADLLGVERLSAGASFGKEISEKT
ncbi:MAG: phosphopentomutase [Elusimicrobiota bacterium]